MTTFDQQKFLAAQFQPRQEAVKVPDLADFFGGNKKDAVWTVRGVSGQELGKINEVAENNKGMKAILEGLMSNVSREKKEAIQRMIGVGVENTQDIAKRLQMLAVASVDPAINIEISIKLCSNFPIEFYLLTNKITELTGRGSVLGKVKPSGKKKKSK